MTSVKNHVSNNLVNSRGKCIDQKIMVIESDDWGSIRMPSSESFNRLKALGIPVQNSPYCLYDTICSPEDIEMLFDTLRRHNDVFGKTPVITANLVTANPNFQKIRETNYKDYFYERCTETMERMYPKGSPYKLWKSGMSEGFFSFQFHCREHVNVPMWLDLLQKKDSYFLAAFEESCFGLSNDVYSSSKRSIQASFDYHAVENLDFIKDSIREGLNLFEEILGFRAKSFIPSNYIWDSQLDNTLQANGIQFIQGMKYQLHPITNAENKRMKTRRFNGMQSGRDLQLTHTVRNCTFEPSLLLNKDRSQSVKNCLTQISNAFFWKKPAVISMHRLNFCGALSMENRDLNLNLFNQLLLEVKRRWPDVIFMDSATLATTLNNN